jgi:hypothetical protein
MSTPATPAAGVNTPLRQLTQSEVQRFLSDAWQWCQMRLAPGRLANHSFSRVDSHAAQNHTDVLRAAKREIFTNYQRAVELQADAYYKSVCDLMFEPQTSAQKTFRPLALSWQVEHPAVAKREKLTLQNQGLAAKEQEWSVEEVNARDDAAKKANEAERAHNAALKSIDRAIEGLVFQNYRGYDHSAIDAARRELREYVAKNLGKKNGVDVLGYITARIAFMHRDYENGNLKWNSR